MDPKAIAAAVQALAGRKPISNSATYNSQLSPAGESGYSGWLRRQSEIMGRDLSADEEDYDLRGLFQSNGGVDLTPGHMTDQFKKPNHPTFSAGSKWNGVDGKQAGEWVETPSGWEFRASPWNVQNLGMKGLMDYFGRVEPKSSLVAPDGRKVR